MLAVKVWREAPFEIFIGYSVVIGGNNICSVDHYLVIDLSLRHSTRDSLVLGRSTSMLSTSGGIYFLLLNWQTLFICFHIFCL